jgi:hypothetical protein
MHAANRTSFRTLSTKKRNRSIRNRSAHETNRVVVEADPVPIAVSGCESILGQVFGFPSVSGQYECKPNHAPVFAAIKARKVQWSLDYL